MSTNTTEDEVRRLKDEIQHLQASFSQLQDESAGENFDNRRSMLLKAQIIQLERQCMLLSNSLSSRAAVLQETENELGSLISRFQLLLGDEKNSGSSVRIPKQELIDHIHSMQKLRKSLYKSSVLAENKSLDVPLPFQSRFSKKKSVTCFDVCNDRSGQLLNMKSVSKLEGDLADLYKQLKAFQVLIRARIPDPKNVESSLSDAILKPPSKVIKNKTKTGLNPEKTVFNSSLLRLSQHADLCNNQLEKCCNNLMVVSLLHPSAPWAVVQNAEQFCALDPNKIARKVMPGKVKNAKFVEAIKAICKAHSYILSMKNLQNGVYEKEMHYSRHIASLQAMSVRNLMEKANVLYQKREEQFASCMLGPVSDVLSAWLKMRKNQSEANMQLFLNSFAKNEDYFISMVNSTEDEVSAIAEIFAESRKEFEASLRQIQDDCVAECNALMKDIDEYKCSNEPDITSYLRDVFLTDE